MTTQFLAVFTGRDTSGGALVVSPPANVHVGDSIVSAVVINQGAGTVPVGTDVTSALISPVQNIPNVEIAVSTPINFSGDYILQQTGLNMNAASILCIMQRG